MNISLTVVLFIVGGFAGFINVLAGGGSLLVLPVMVMMGIPGPVANGTNRVAILAQCVSATTSFFRNGFSDFKLSLTLTLCAIPGTVIGALLGVKLSGVWFNRTLSVIIFILLIIMANKPNRNAEEKNNKQHPNRLILAHILMIGAGFYGGFIQAGVGFILIAIIHKTLNMDLVRVNMHKVFIVGMYTIVAIVIYSFNGNVAWIPGICLAAGNSIGGWLGSVFAIKKGDRTIRIILVIVLAIMAVKLLLI
ncbi:MAG: sulfite exporter TauE/SafE family protein [Candidatus Theseobacter exili]|nr:sulfite exporter TauE/SafE family protein [Candidatus Theseobacter exili]